MNAATTSRVQDLLAQPITAIVVGHKNPDGDAVGSCQALARFLRKSGHQAQVVMPNDFPDFLKWIPGCDQMLLFDKQNQQAKSAIDKAQLIFTLDFNALNRTGDMSAYLESADAQFVMIDHHQQPDDYAVAQYSDVSMSSTCQMVYHFMESLGQLDLLDKEMATQLYTGIMTDTGSFRFPSTTATTHKVIAHLIETGAESATIHQNVYDTNSRDRMKLLGVALNNMVLLPEYRTAYITLSQDELDAHNFKKGDTEGFVNYALSVSDIIFAVIFIENRQEGITKISFRSKGNFSVNTFARNHFEGGGHTNAAGGRSLQSLTQTVQEFISILPTYKTALNDVS